MAKSKVLLDFINDSVPVKIQYTRDRVIDMTGNANFTDPDVVLDDWGDSATTLETKYNAAQGGGTAQTEEQNAAELVMDDLSRKQAAYVDRIADGSKVIITSAGFSASDIEGTDKPAPEKPENHKLSHGEQQGTIQSGIDKLTDSRGFVTVLKEDPAIDIVVNGDQMTIDAGGSKVVIHVGTKRKATIANLTRGTIYYVTKYGFNASGRGPDSDSEDIVAP